MTEPIHIRARKFLQEFFSDEELTNFCFDYFPQVYNDFSLGMPKNQKVRRLVEKNQRDGRLDELLGALERERPKSYPDYFTEKLRYIDPEPRIPKKIERNPYQIFISHAHQDNKFAKRLATDLQKKGWQTWMAPDDIRPGEKWVEAINRGLAESSIFILILTKEAVNSRWVRSETDVAIHMEHGGEISLLPLVLESVVTPPMWRAYQWIMFSEDYNDGFYQLIRELSSDTNKSRVYFPAGRKNKTDDEVLVEITLEEAFYGTSRTLQYENGHTIEAKIPQGVKDGTRIRLKNAGKRNEIGQTEHLFVIVKILPHHHFQCEGDDLWSTIAVDLYTLVLGGQVDVSTIDRVVRLTVPQGTDCGKQFRLRGLGMPTLKRPNERGHLYVRLMADIPKNLSKKEQRLFKELRIIRG